MKKRTSRGVYRKLASFLKPYLPLILLALLFSTIQIAATLLSPVVVGKTIDYIVGEGNVDFGLIARNAIVLAALIATAMLFQYLASLALNAASYKSVRDLRTAAFDKLDRVPLGYIDSRSQGDIMARVGSDVDQISDGLIQGFTQFFSGIVTIAGTLVFMLSLNYVIAIVVVLVTPLSLVTAYFISKGCHNMFAGQAAKRGELSGLITETLTAQRTMRLFGYEDKAKQRFAVINGELKVVGQNAAFYSAMVNPCTRFVNNIVYAAVCIFGALLVIRGTSFAGAGVLTVGTLSCFLTYANQYTKPFNEITGVITELQTASAAADRVFALLETDEQSSDASLPALPKPDGAIDIDDVCFSYVPERPLIEHFSLSVAQGKRVAIVGPTGCGKTTMINLLMRFYDPVSGEIRVDGTPTESVTRASLRGSYGMVLQETWLKNASVRDNIAYGKPEATQEEIEAAAKAASVHNFITHLPQGYDTILGEEGGNISAGQKQLLCIARVLLTRPPMLILDEATSSIDTRTELKIQRAFDILMEGKTSFIVAHRLSTITGADVILVMRDGHVVEQGTHAELLKKGGFYHDLYNSQFAK